MVFNGQLIYHYLMKAHASSKVNFFSKTKSVGLAFTMLFITFPSMGEVTASKVDISVLGSKCNDRVKEVSSVSGVLRFPSKTTGQVPAVVILHSNAGIVGVGDFYARALNAAGMATLEVDSFLPRGVRSGSERNAPVDPAVAIAVLEKMQSLKGNDPRVELLFSTHPSPAERLDSLLQSKIDVLTRPSPDLLRKRENRFKQFRSAL